MYDAIVLGARCAGSPTAMLLARKGYRVLLVDKATFPSDTMSTLLIYPKGIARLARWGLLDSVRASNCPSLRSWKLTFDDIELNGFPWSPDGVTETLAPRRTVLDRILVDAAVAAGAELREGFVFEEILREGDSVIGIRGRSPAGATHEEKARVVIGADGMRSPFASAIRAEKVLERPIATCVYYSFHSGVEQPYLGQHVRGRCGLAAFPTNDGNTLVVVAWPHERFHEFRSDIEGNYLRSIDEVWPELGARVRAGKREERFMGTADLQNYFRRSHGPNWALVGDAGYHKDPITAQGISDSFASAELLAEAVDDGLSGRRPLAEALEDYERRRNETAMPVFDWTYRVAEMRPVSARMSILLTSLKASQDDTNRFMGLTAGTVPSTEFFQPENLARIVAAAG